MTRCHTQYMHVEVERAFNEQSIALLTNSPNSRKWWVIAKTAVFSASSILPPFTDREGRLV